MFFIIFAEENIMTKIIAYFLFQLWLLSIQTNSSYLSPSKNMNYSLNNNIVLNGNISTPVIAPSSFWNYYFTQSNWSTHGFFVQYVDACLILSSFSQLCPSLTGVTCGWQFLDADSTLTNEHYYQKYTMSAIGQYQLKFDWITAKPNIASNGLSVMWNGVAIDSFYDASCSLHTSTYYVLSNKGTNELGFKSIGTADSWGVMIRNIRLQLLVYISPTVIPNNTNSSSPSNNTSTNPTTTPPPSDSPSNNTFSNSTTSNNTTNSTSNYTAQNNSTNSTTNDTYFSNDTSTQNNTSNSSSHIDPNNPTDHFVPIDFNTFLQQLNASEYKRIAQIISFINNFEANKIMNELSATKRTTKFIMGFAIEFNHFVFYNFHLRNYTIMANLILSGIQALDDQKGTIIDDYIYPFLGIQPSAIVDRYNYGEDILPVNLNNLIPDFVRRSNGFVLDCMDFVFFELPLTLVIYLLGCLLFRILFHLRASILFRQYSIVGYFFVILLDGKVQSYTFFFLTEVKLMPSVDFTQKMGISAMMIFYFGVLIYSIGSMLLFQSLYRKLTKYLYENCAGELRSAFILLVSVGPYNLLLGAVHCLLLNSPTIQIIALFLIELCYFIFQLYLCFSTFFESKAKVVVQLMMSLIRIVFQISFFLYDLFEMSYDYEISITQQYLYFCFLGCWGLSSLLLFFEKVRLIWLIIKHTVNNKNSVLPFSEQQEISNIIHSNLASFNDEQGNQLKTVYHKLTRKAIFMQTFKGLRSKPKAREQKAETNNIVSKESIKRTPIIQFTFKNKQLEHENKQFKTKQDRTARFNRKLNQRLQFKTIFESNQS